MRVEKGGDLLLEDVPLEVIGEAIRRVPAKKYVASYVAIREKMEKGKGKKK